MAAVRAIDGLVANTAAAVLASATLDKVQRHNRDDELDEDSPRTKRCLLYTSPSPRDKRQSRMPSSA